MLLGQAAGFETGAQAPIGRRGQQRAADPPVESGRDAHGRISQDLDRPAYQGLERGPILLRGGPRIAAPELGPAESIHRLDEGAKLVGPGRGRVVQGPDHRARTPEPRDPARLGGLPALREPGRQRVPGLDELVGRYLSQSVGGRPAHGGASPSGDCRTRP